MSVIYGNPITLGGGGGAELNIDYGSTPPTDTSKLWVPLAKKPNSVECSPVLNYGANTIELKSTIPANQVGYPAVARVGRKIYILGGSSSISTGNMVKNISIYDIDSGEISTLSTTLSVSRMQAYCAAVNSKIYLIGGLTPSASPSNTIEAFDPATNAITACTNLPTAFRTMNSNSCVVVGSKIYIMGYLSGSGYNLSILYYDTESDTVVDTGKKAITCNAACVYVNGKIYGFGGVNSSGDLFGKYWSFDPVTLEVTTIGTYNYNNMSAASVNNEKIHLFQGYDSSYNLYNTIQVYDVNANTFQTLSITTNEKLGNRHMVTDGLDIYVIGGDYASTKTPANNIEKFSSNTALQSNRLFLQADFGTSNPFPIINDTKVKITAYLRNAYLGDSNNFAQVTNAYIYDATAGKWKTLSGESYVSDMLNALNVMGVN